MGYGGWLHVAPRPGWTHAASLLDRRAACHCTIPPCWAFLAVTGVSHRIAPRPLIARRASRHGISSLAARVCSCGASHALGWAVYTGRTGISASWAIRAARELSRTGLCPVRPCGALRTVVSARLPFELLVRACGASNAAALLRRTHCGRIRALLAFCARRLRFRALHLAPEPKMNLKAGEQSTKSASEVNAHNYKMLIHGLGANVQLHTVLTSFTHDLL